MAAPTTACIEWDGYIDNEGYGRTMDGGAWDRAHRVVWREANGPIPDGLVIDHLCRNRSCVNTRHMELVTSVENSRRGFGASAVNARKTHCIHGHPFDEANTYVPADGSRRQCRTCNREAVARYTQRRREDVSA